MVAAWGPGKLKECNNIITIIKIIIRPGAEKSKP
jgi:hypothetical protein